MYSDTVLSKMETVAVQKRKVKSVKTAEKGKVDLELVESIKRSLEDLKAGRIRRVR